MTQSSEKIVSNNQALVDALVKFQRWCEAGGPELVAELASLKAQLAEAANFKLYVHKRLDEAGVPHEVPESPHTAAGCRVGGRFDWVKGRLAAAEKEHFALRGKLFQLAAVCRAPCQVSGNWVADEIEKLLNPEA